MTRTQTVGLLILHFHSVSGIIATEIEMAQIELTPDLSHCIETVAKKEYQNLVSSYLHTGKGDVEFEGKVELLRTFLESADFKKLRKESEEYLVKGQHVKFILYREEGETKYRLVHC